MALARLTTPLTLEALALPGSLLPDAERERLVLMLRRWALDAEYLRRVSWEAADAAVSDAERDEDAEAWRDATTPADGRDPEDDEDEDDEEGDEERSMMASIYGQDEEGD